MKLLPFSLFGAFVTLVSAQNLTLLTELDQALTAAGLTSLVSVASTLNSSGVGQYLLANLSNGSPHLLFAPNNEALTNVPSNISLTDLIGYHIVPGTFANVTVYPNTTVGRTLLTDPQFVTLEGDNRAQVVAWAERADGKTHVLNRRNDSTVVNVTSVGNLTIYVVDHLLIPPENLTSTIPTLNNSLTALEPILREIPAPLFNASSNSTVNTTLFDALESQYHGFTFFAPNNSAIQAAQANLTQLGSNITALQALAFNHLINATTLYSPELVNQDRTSAAGETFSFTLNSTGHFVTIGNVTALILQPDVLLPNGVIHIIDRVLIDIEENLPAASSALSSATSAAAVTPTETAPIGFSQTVSLAPSGSGGSGSSHSGAVPLIARDSMVAILMALAGILAGVFVTMV